MSQTELEMGANQLIVSKSDSAGKITYCNQCFIELTGYTENELIKQPHNIIRHPDMPGGIFYLMWQTLKQKHEFNGFIKNKTKDGNCYWAFTNITPVLNPNGQITGYTSASRAPNIAATSLFEMFYEQMLESENGNTSESACKQSLQQLNELLNAMGDNYEASVFKLQFS